MRTGASAAVIAVQVSPGWGPVFDPLAAELVGVQREFDHRRPGALSDPGGEVETERRVPEMTTAGVPVTVSARTRATVVQAFDAIAPIDLPRIFTGLGPLPAVVGVRDQTGDWDHVGATRIVELAGVRRRSGSPSTTVQLTSPTGSD